MEGYKHYLCDLFMRRGRPIERAIVAKLLRAVPSDPADGTSMSIDGLFLERARLASGLDRTCERGLLSAPLNNQQSRD
jgi:hypothetical protein